MISVRLGASDTTRTGAAAPAAAAQFPDSYFDWIFLDANHGYEGMRQDLLAFCPKVKPGGYIAGHDYVEVKGYGVVQAVDEFARTHPVHLVALSSDEYASFILRKRLAAGPQKPTAPSPAPRRSPLRGTPLCPGMLALPREGAQ